MAVRTNLDQTLKLNQDLADKLARMCEENQKLGEERDKLRVLAVQSDQANVQSFEDEVQRRLKGSQAELAKAIKDEVERRLKSELELAADARAESEKRLGSEIKNLQAQLAEKDELAENAKADAIKRMESTKVNFMRDIEELRRKLFKTSQQLVSAERDQDNLRSHLTKSNEIALETSQKLKDAYNEQGGLKTELAQAEWNLKQRNDDHCKLEILEPIMEERGKTIERLEREVEEQKGVIEAKKEENLDQQVKLKTKDRQLEEARNAVSQAEREKDALRVGAQLVAERHKANLAQAREDIQKEKNKGIKRNDRIKELKDDKKELKQKVQELRMENRRLEETKNKSSWSLRRK